jgi:hypothetical protein
LNTTPSEYSVGLVDGSGIERKKNFYHTDNVNIGSLRFDNVCYTVENLDVFEKYLCTHIDGLLGTNILRLLNWEIDFANQTINVSSKPFSSANYGMEIPFRETFSGTPQIKIMMGKYYFWAELDMGYNDYIAIKDSVFLKSEKTPQNMPEAGVKVRKRYLMMKRLKTNMFPIWIRFISELKREII